MSVLSFLENIINMKYLRILNYNYNIKIIWLFLIANNFNQYLTNK